MGRSVGSGVGTVTENGVFVADGTATGSPGVGATPTPCGVVVAVGFGAIRGGVVVEVARVSAVAVAVVVGGGVRVGVMCGVGVRVGAVETGRVGVLVGVLVNGAVKSPASGVANAPLTDNAATSSALAAAVIDAMRNVRGMAYSRRRSRPRAEWSWRLSYSPVTNCDRSAKTVPGSLITGIGYDHVESGHRSRTNACARSA